MTVIAEPAAVPARMLNEFTFCERLFFLEWVDRLWTGNADTVEGDSGIVASMPGEGPPRSRPKAT